MNPPYADEDDRTLQAGLCEDHEHLLLRVTDGDAVAASGAPVPPAGAATAAPVPDPSGTGAATPGRAAEPLSCRAQTPRGADGPPLPSPLCEAPSRGPGNGTRAASTAGPGSRDGEPTLRLLSLGAGRQSTTLALLSAQGELPKLDGAIFADTGWEPQAVYDHLDRLEREVLEPAGIPLYRVGRGNLRDDLLNPDKMAMIPAYTLGAARDAEIIDESLPCPRCETAGVTWLADTDLPDTLANRLPEPRQCPRCHGTGRVILRSHAENQRERGMLKRKCTLNYKLGPIRTQTRRLLGAPAYDPKPCRYCDGTGQRIAPWRAKRGENIAGTCSVCDGSGEVVRVGPPPAGLWAEQWVGFSTDEIGRVSGHTDARYVRSRYPLIDLGMSVTQCLAFLRHHGWDSVLKSACVGCPYHGNRHWRKVRDERPAEWAEAVTFDEAYRHGPGMRSERFLHISCKPLADAPIDAFQRTDLVQTDIFDQAYEIRLEEGEPDGCSPFGCRSGEAVA